MSILKTGKALNDAGTKVLTPAFTASYVKVLEPAETLNGDLKYSVSMIFPKDTTDLAVLETAVREAMAAKFGKKLPPNAKNPIRDGDTERDSPEYANSWFINASSTRRPQVVDYSTGDLVTDDTDDMGIYSGCKCRASVAFFGYDASGNRGVGVGLNNIQVLRRTARIDGSTSANQDFGSADDEAIDLDDL